MSSFILRYMISEIALSNTNVNLIYTRQLPETRAGNQSTCNECRTWTTEGKHVLVCIYLQCQIDITGKWRQENQKQIQTSSDSYYNNWSSLLYTVTKFVVNMISALGILVNQKSAFLIKVKYIPYDTLVVYKSLKQTGLIV